MTPAADSHSSKTNDTNVGSNAGTSNSCDLVPKEASAEAVAADATFAQMLQTIEQLTAVFRFDPHLAEQAVQVVGPDISAAYNWILDEGGGQDKGGPIVPRMDCPHIQQHLRVTCDEIIGHVGLLCDYFTSEEHKKGNANPKSEVDETTGLCPPGENWVCLECNVTRCSRYVNGHCMAHWEATKAAQGIDGDGAGHCLSVSLADLSVWCYECNAYLEHADLDPITKKLEELKFGGLNTASLNDDENDAILPPLQFCLQKKVAKEEFEQHNSEDDNDERCYSKIDSDDPEAQFYNKMHNFVHAVESFTPLLPRSLKELAEFILSKNCKSIILLAGAGMSRASGIPDFRSAGGMYETLRPELLTATPIEREAMKADPTMVFEKSMFLQNSLPCLELKRPFILGTRAQTWKATLAHRFVELLHGKTGKLTRLYTQNIDGLEGQCHDLPRELIVPVHGSMDRASCEICGTDMDFDHFCRLVETNIKDITGKDDRAPKESTPIVCHMCGCATVKPTIVLFRANLPDIFYERVVEDLPSADLLIIIGTSLCVAPANSIVYKVPPSALRLVINNESVGHGLGIRYGKDSTRDYFARGKCDEILLDLMVHLGWMDDLRKVLDYLPESSASLLRDHLKQL